MIWKILLGLALFGLLACIIFAVISARTFYASSFQSSAEDVAFAGLLMSIVGALVSLLVGAVAVIFVLRGSKKEWNSANPK